MNYKTEMSLLYSYNSYNTCIIPSRVKLIHFNEHTCYNTFFNISLLPNSSNEYLVPIFFRKYVEDFIYNQYQLDSPLYEKLVIPLYAESYGRPKSTTDSIITYLLDNTATDVILNHIKTKSGKHFYGNKGMILDSEFKPLFLLFFKAKLEDNKFKYNKIISYISPNTLSNTDIVSKGILKYIIPFIHDTGLKVRYFRSDYFHVENDINDVDTIFSYNINNFIKYNNPLPYNIQKINDISNNLLCNNKDEIVKMMF